jgi:hypothetical protein
MHELSQDDGGNGPGDESDYDEASEILEDIQEALSLARRQGVLPPVRIARILAGEGTGQFSSPGAAKSASQQRTVPLSVALDYVGAILDESRKEIGCLKSEVEEYNQLCNSMEKEVESLLRSSQGLPAPKGKPYFCALVKVMQLGSYPITLLEQRIKDHPKSMSRKCMRKYVWLRTTMKKQKTKQIYLERLSGGRWIRPTTAFRLFPDSLQRALCNNYCFGTRSVVNNTDFLYHSGISAF